jgi:hypothetical protein
MRMSSGPSNEKKNPVPGCRSGASSRPGPSERPPRSWRKLSKMVESRRAEWRTRIDDLAQLLQPPRGPCRMPARPPGPSRSSISRECPPRPKVASTYSCLPVVEGPRRLRSTRRWCVAMGYAPSAFRTPEVPEDSQASRPSWPPPPGRHSLPCPRVRSDCPCPATWCRWKCRLLLATPGRPDTPRCIQLHVHGVAQEDPLPPLRIHRHCSDALPKLLPSGTRENHQAAMGVLGDGQLAPSASHQQVAVTRRDRQTPLSVQTQRRPALKHRREPSCFDEMTHQGHNSPHSTTFLHCSRKCSACKHACNTFFQ